MLVAGAVAQAQVEAPLQPPLADPVLEHRYRSLIREIRCPLCPNASIAESGAPIAADLRAEIRRLLLAGESDDAIKDYLSSRYGDFVLYKPRFNPTTWVLWGGPIALLAIGSFVFWRVLRTRRNQPLDEDPT